MSLQRTLSVVHQVSAAAVRALALFALANLLLGLFSKNWNANDLWIQAAVLPAWVVQTLVITFAVGVLVLSRVHPAAKIGTRIVGVLLGLACLTDAVGYYRLLADGRITSAFPVPLSLVLGFVLLVWGLSGRRRRFSSTSRTRRALWISVLEHSAPLVLLGLGALGHIMSFGATDYSRSADAAVVFGAAVRPGGEPSTALLDRTLTACDLYHRGLVDTLVLSGGRNPSAPLSEPACMAQIARAQGVPDHALVLDETGLDTAASIRAAADLATEHGWSSLLMVSHDYHLARIKLTCDRAGIRAATVPATETRWILKKPWFVAREVLAFGWYLLRPAFRGVS